MAAPIMHRNLLLILLAIAGSAQAITLKEYQPRGGQPTIIDAEGKAVPLYSASYALLVSESNYLGSYKRGWRRLESTASELDAVAVALQAQGFYVLRVSDANASELIEQFRSFMGRYGRGTAAKDNRLLFFFSGHGYTSKQNEMGYLVPIDALDPNLHEGEFYAKALPIETIQTWAKELSARHALFLFDSCFSGSIFTTKSALTQPDPRGSTSTERYRFFIQSSSKPVRQFISAGGPDEELPSQSQFIPLFIEAISGKASRTSDGYVTGKEIGIWIEQTLPRFSANQNPHSDVIRVAPLSFGDMVFRPYVTNVAIAPPVTGPAMPMERRVSPTAPLTTPANMQPEAGAQRKSEPRSEKVTLAADAFFNVASSSLLPEGRAKLDELVTKSAGLNLEVIIAVGHADASEATSDGEAQKLSVRRAEAVKTYLVERGAIRNRVYTEGKGRKPPVASNSNSEGRSKNRRVEIELVGTRASLDIEKPLKAQYS